MHRELLLALFVAFGLMSPSTAQAQLIADTLFTWQGYARIAQTQLRLYHNPAEEKRPYTVVLQELAANDGPSTVTDARYLADEIGRTFGIDPAEAYWVFHWGGFSYAGAQPDAKKELFIRATFTRSTSDRLMGPSWRIVGRDDVLAYTDRQFQ